MKAQRCLTTYETHPDSVWSLYSDHPDLKTFYAGSRDGLVTKTEIPREGGPTDKYDESECIGLFKENSGVGKVIRHSIIRGNPVVAKLINLSTCFRLWLSTIPTSGLLPQAQVSIDG
jgi:hypothetical protein